MATISPVWLVWAGPGIRADVLTAACGIFFAVVGAGAVGVDSYGGNAGHVGRGWGRLRRCAGSSGECRGSVKMRKQSVKLEQAVTVGSTVITSPALGWSPDYAGVVVSRNAM